MGMYCTSISWACDQKYVVIVSRPRYEYDEDCPLGEENYGIMTYSRYDAEEEDPSKMVKIMGQFKIDD